MTGLTQHRQATETAIIKHFFSPFLAGLACLFFTAGCHSVNAEPDVATPAVQLGPRPYYLVEQMTPGPLRDRLSRCAAERQDFHSSKFSIGHRGAPLQFPEHTRESYVAAARMGAGVLECDVTFTADRQLVCRHSQCDLHTTTDIVATDLAEKCSVPPVLDADNRLTNAGEIRCCTSDITLADFKTLHGKMDSSDTGATTIEDYMGGVADYRTTLYSGGSRGTLLSHAESIALFEALGVDMTPELKAPQVRMPFQGDYTQDDYARQLIEEYIAAGIPPARVQAQSFNLRDVAYWLDNYPAFGAGAVLLEGRQGFDSNDPEKVAALDPSLPELAARGVSTLAPPIFMLLATEDGRIVASAYAREARRAGLELVAWTTERSGKLEPGTGRATYQTVKDLVENDGDILTVIDALASEAGVSAVFSDWPATTTFYANCMNPGTEPPSRMPPAGRSGSRYGRR